MVDAHSTLFERIGGSDTFDQLVRAFYEGIREDDVLLPMYPQVLWWASDLFRTARSSALTDAPLSVQGKP